jgi:hypothetical protein
VFLVYRMDRSFLGLPTDWKKVGRLLANRPRFPIGWLPAVVMKKPAPRIPVMKLEDYLKSPPQSFRATFPKNELLVKLLCSVNVSAMEKLVEVSKGHLKLSAYDRCKRSIENFKEGAPLVQKGLLPACFVKNSKSCYVHGE